MEYSSIVATEATADFNRRFWALMISQAHIRQEEEPATP
jgi:hypothetical protein